MGGMADERNPYTRAIAGVIKAERHRAGLTQKQLAEQSGLALVTIARFEGVLRAPDTEQLQAIAAVFGRPPSWMLEQAEDQVARMGE